MISVTVKILLVTVCLSYSGTTATDIKDCIVDAVLVIDNSGSITYGRQIMQNWDFVIQFAQDIASGINIGPDTSHIGLVDFHTKAKIHFGLTDHTTEADAVKAIGELPYEGWTTNTPEGLQFGRDVLTLPDFGGRNDVPKIMFVITDGEPSENVAALLDEEIQKTRDANIRIIAIGVTAEVKLETLQKLASTDKDYFLADNFDRLQEIKDAVLNEDTCKPPPPPPPAEPEREPEPEAPEPIVITDASLRKPCEEL